MVNGVVGLFVPGDVIRERCSRYKMKGRPERRSAMLHDTDFTIVSAYGAERDCTVFGVTHEHDGVAFE
jgi:hypothetical protein